MFIISVAGFIVTLLMLPVYGLVSSQVDNYSSFAQEAAEKVAEYDLSASSLVSANKQAMMLVKQKETSDFSQMVDLFESLKGDGIAISNFEFVRKDKVEIGQINIQGRALDRQDLVDFRDALLKQAVIKSVDLPISNLAKDKNIPFTITVEVVNNES